MDEEEVDRQIANDNERADKLGLVLDSDPRRTDARGAEKVEATDSQDTGDGAESAGKSPRKEQDRKEMIQ
jgi:capsid protein